MNGPIMVLDVESVGLWGQAFAWGYVVVDPTTGEELAARREVLDVDRDDQSLWTMGGWEGVAWVKRECGHLIQHPSMPSVRAFRDAFWADWALWKSHGATLWADCGYPVEVNFLHAGMGGVDLVLDRRYAVYPLHEIASGMVAAGRDPLATYDRLSSELPKHDPLADARQSARLLLECFAILRERKETAEQWERVQSDDLERD